MPRLSVEEFQEFLSARHRLLRLATLALDGRPYIVPIWFLYADQYLYFTARAKSEWYRHLEENPWIAATIDEDVQPYRKVLVRGVSHKLYSPGQDAEWRDIYRRIAERYLDPEKAEAYLQATVDEPRSLHRVAFQDADVSTWRLPVRGEGARSTWATRYYASEKSFKSI